MPRRDLHAGSAEEPGNVTRCEVDRATLIRTDWEGAEWERRSEAAPHRGVPAHLPEREEREERAYALRRSQMKRVSMAARKVGVWTDAHAACELRPPLPSIERTLLREKQLPLWLDTKDQNSRTPWHVLCSNPDVEAAALKCLAQRCTDSLAALDSAGRTPLHVLCQNDALDGKELQRCLKDGKDGSAFLKGFLRTNGLLAAQDEHGQTALHYLCLREDVYAVIPAMQL
eukprot:SAG22_NODE_6204_length_886_cov_1.658196_1_plen_228_part_10